MCFLLENIFVLGNDGDVQGAAYMFDEKLMEKIAAKLDASLVILPSSVDEVIIMRETEGMDMDFMKGMVREVNETTVKPEMQLSNEIYRYDRESHMLSMIKPAQPEEDIQPDLPGREDVHDYDCDGQGGCMMSCMMQ